MFIKPLCLKRISISAACPRIFKLGDRAEKKTKEGFL